MDEGCNRGRMKRMKNNKYIKTLIDFIAVGFGFYIGLTLRSEQSSAIRINPIKPFSLRG